ncbi:BON domain-containing protein [Psychrobacter sp. FDAARGOS_221]|uniref:BON domain-containing protein n=1 Tax=Psychrobacter sp. FDAARGOS_221 TaxID=1975705 RepID=UPI000BB57443|nr:BON domain-containing protein [Psychrobacter sp. FDAARGOS_221]PNK60261.1 BON domain-containing protein [Psychrobacter sp. FDAARGOS_221]
MASSWLLANKVVRSSALCMALGVGVLSGCTSLQTMTAPNESYGVAATDRTLAQRILDKSIENTILVNINRQDPTLHERSRINVYSFYSTVLVTGEVPDEANKKQIDTIISSMPDVKEFYNQLNVGNFKGASYTVHDTYISSKVNAKILANSGISGRQIKIVTDDGIVYAMGKLTPSQRGHLLNIVDSTVGIKQLVLLTQLIDDYGQPLDENSISQETGLEPPAARYTEAPVVIEAPAQQAVASQDASQSSQATAQTQNSGVPIVTPQAQAGGAAPSSGQPQAQAPAQPVQPAQPTQTSGNPSGQTPTTQGSSTYASPYIEMYKKEVPGW